MRKIIVWPMMLVLILLMMAPGAYAEGPFRVAGYDHEDTQHVWTDNLFFVRMQEKTGVEMTLEQYTTAESWAKAKAAMFADGGELPDAIFKAALTPQETLQWYAEGKLIDLKPYLEESCPNLWALLKTHPEWEQAITLPDGAIVALPALDELQFNNAMWINKSWLDSIGMAVPTTAEELTAVLRAFRDYDMNTNGNSKDEIPLTFSSLWDLRFLAHAFGINANDYYMTMSEDGTVSEILTSDANRAFLTWLNLLWTEGLLDESGFTGLRSLSSSTEEDAAIVYGMMMASSPIELVNSSALDQYVLLEPFVYEGKQVYRDLTGDVVRGTFAITSACADPAALLKWVDYLYTEEGFILAEAGVEGEEFAWNDDGTWLWEHSADMLMSSVLPEATIRSGTSMPGWASVSFQQKIDEAATVRLINAISRLHELDSEPYPLVWLTAEQQSRVDALQYAIGSYAERQMTWFVAGDVALTDETWNEFCNTVKELGVDEMVGIWQSAADSRY
ncbi:MAG: extracellular solute-binding protein [Clostridia bacterium]|nr:extracellular solute-binding protein [Clostridia bacterium]